MSVFAAARLHEYGIGKSIGTPLVSKWFSVRPNNKELRSVNMELALLPCGVHLRWTMIKRASQGYRTMNHKSTDILNPHIPQLNEQFKYAGQHSAHYPDTPQPATQHWDDYTQKMPPIGLFH
jgi:hypothetical protein